MTLPLRTVTASELSVPLTPLVEARAGVVAMAQPLASQVMPLRAALGHVAVETVVSEHAVPPFDNSSMDGFAVLAADHQAPGRMLLRSPSKIATGMPLPSGTDAVVPWEHVVEQDGARYLGRPVAQGQFVRAAGHDIATGTHLVERGTELGPVHLGALAAIGRSHVRAYQRPTVALIVTGSELAQPGDALDDGGVYDINSTLVPALLRRAGVGDVAVTQCTDEPDIIEAVIRTAAAGADLVVTTGGASVGERDWVRAVLAKHDPDLLWRIAVRPGKPFAAARVDGTVTLALPGNPGSVLACTQAFVVPAIRRMRGLRGLPPTVGLELREPIDNPGDRTFFCALKADGGDAWPLVGATSQGIAHATEVNAFVAVPAGTHWSQGEPIEAELMG